MTGQLLNAISSGPWSAGAIIKLDEAGGWMGFAGNTESYSIGQHAYYAKLDGSVLRQVTKGRGSHIVSFSADGSVVLDTFHNLENPGEQWLRKNDGTDIRKILARRGPKGAEYAQWKQIKARDGETLDITYSLPKNFDPNSFVDYEGDVCIIPPNSFALARSVELMKIPRRILCVCVGKSTYARCGIITNVTPLEPGWEGHITLEISNTTTLPAKIYANEGLVQVLFFESDEDCETSYGDRGGKYQGQRGVTLPKA